MKKMHINKIISTAIALGLSSPVTLAAQGKVGIEEVIVSAQKREQSVQDISIAITAFDAEDIKTLQFREPNDIANFVPNVTGVNVFGNNMTNFVIRGMGLNDIAPNNNTPAATHLDEVYLGFAAMLNFGLFDIERVEVLKGPQGTLYGRNTTGGAISFFSRRPTQDLEAKLTTSYGNYQNFETDGFINIPINDQFATRFSAFTQQQNSGPYKNRHYNERRGEIDKYGWRAQFNYQSNDSVEANLNIHGGADNSHHRDYSVFLTGEGRGFDEDLGGYPPFCEGYLTGDLVANDPDCFGYIGEQEPDNDPFTNANSQRGRIDSDSLGANLIINWDTSIGKLTSITAYEELDRYLAEDADGFEVQIVEDYYENYIKQYSQEIRLSSHEDTPLYWLAGLYWDKNEIDTPRHEAKSFYARGRGARSSYLQEGESAGAFFHMEYELAPKWRMNLGLRYTWEERKFEGSTFATTSTNTDSNEEPADDLFAFASAENQADFTGTSGKIGLDYQIDEDKLVYVSISKGFKSGGFNGNLAFADASLDSFDPEEVIVYEIGSKLQLFDSKVVWNSAVFYNDYSDIQLLGNYTIEGPLGPVNVFALTNLADATVYGAETEIQLNPSVGWDMRLAAGWLETEIENTTAGNEHLQGNELANSPKLNVSGVIRYEHPLGELLGSAQIDFIWQDDYFANMSNSPIQQLDSYTVVGARFALRDQADIWELSLWSRNLLDEEYFTYVSDLGSTLRVLKNAGYPRTYGIELSYRW